MSKTNTRWDDLSIKQKSSLFAEIAKEYANGGDMPRLSQIREAYNNYTSKPMSYNEVPNVRYEDGNYYPIGGQLVIGPNANPLRKAINKIAFKLKGDVVGKANTPECAQWSNRELTKYFGDGIYGDAWTRNIYNNTTKVYSGYDGLKKPSKYNENDAVDYLTNAAINLKDNIDLSALKDGDMVGMYFNASPNFEKAFNNGAGNETHTHTGHIRVEDGVPYVYHNVHGNIIKNKAKSVLGPNHPYGIVSVYRYNKK